VPTPDEVSDQTHHMRYCRATLGNWAACLAWLGLACLACPPPPQQSSKKCKNKLFFNVCGPKGSTTCRKPVFFVFKVCGPKGFKKRYKTVLKAFVSLKLHACVLTIMVRKWKNNANKLNKTIMSYMKDCKKEQFCYFLLAFLAYLGLENRFGNRPWAGTIPAT